jgi:predicted amidohydrolase YtcJ
MITGAFLLLLMFASCTMKQKADLLLTHGKIYTVDSAFSIHQAMAIGEGMILATGTDEEILSQFSSETVVDLGGKPVYPGFNDGHCHFYGYALTRYQWLDLKGTGSFEEILQALVMHHRDQPSSWILGRGWDQNDWAVKEFPDNTKLDELFPDIPVVLTRIDGHALLANSAAMEKAGINAETRIEGGEIRTANGKPTGLLVDNAADRMKVAIPEPDLEVIREALKKAQEDCFAVGLTSVSDAGLEYENIMLIDSMQANGNLLIRINAMLSPSEKNLAEFVERGPFQKDRLTVVSVKLYADGALGSRGALLTQPYADDPGKLGLQINSVDYYRDLLQLAYQKNFQVNTHCIGDSANRLMLNLYAEMLRGPNDRRWRIEHAQVVHPEDFKLFGNFNIIPSVQSTHCTSDMYWAGERLGPERVKNAYAYKQLLHQNGWLINGTDFPIEEIDPLLTFYAAVSRADKSGYPEGGFQPENALSREEALRSITAWPARGSFEEHRKGTLEAGKMADFVILQKDLMTVDLKEIPEIEIAETYLNGIRVH